MTARLSVGRCPVALIGGPPLVGGCCGSPWAADRPPCGRFPALPVVGGRGPCRAVGFRPARGSYAASSSAGLPLSMIICSVSLAVYPHATNWFR